jgi:asparagine synthase (glutamine-hydrolysing)
MASTMADAGSGPTLTRPAQHPERISSSRARSSAKRHPPRVQGALPPGRRREVPEPRAPPIKRQPFSPGSRIPARLVSLPKKKTARLLLLLRRAGIMCGILAVLGCSDWSQAKRARILACSRRQAPIHPLHLISSSPLPNTLESRLASILLVSVRPPSGRAPRGS